MKHTWLELMKAVKLEWLVANQSHKSKASGSQYELGA